MKPKKECLTIETTRYRKKRKVRLHFNNKSISIPIEEFEDFKDAVNDSYSNLIEEGFMESSKMAKFRLNQMMSMGIKESLSKGEEVDFEEAETRSEDEIIDAINRIESIVWWNRHKIFADEGFPKTDKDTIREAKKAAKEVERTIGLDDLIMEPNDFLILLGNLGALRWTMGNIDMEDFST